MTPRKKPGPGSYDVVSANTAAVVVSGLPSLRAAKAEAARLNEEAAGQGIRHEGVPQAYEARSSAGLLVP